MKNRIISALLAVCVIIPAAAYAAGCFGPGMVTSQSRDANPDPAGSMNCTVGCCTGNLTSASPIGCCRITQTYPSLSGCCTNGQTCNCPAVNGGDVQTNENTGQSGCLNGPVDLQGWCRTNARGGVSWCGCSPGSADAPLAQVRGCCL